MEGLRKTTEVLSEESWLCSQGAESSVCGNLLTCVCLALSGVCPMCKLAGGFMHRRVVRTPAADGASHEV
jgi:hypothetical protein